MTDHLTLKIIWLEMSFQIVLITDA